MLNKTEPGCLAYIQKTTDDSEEEALGTISRERFIRLGTALGVGAACASLVACGRGASSSGGGGSGGGKPGGGGSGGGSQAASSGDSSQASSSGGNSQAASSSSGGGAKAGGAETGGTAIAKVSEVAPGSAFKFKDSGNPAVLVHLKSGDFVAYSAVCTHQGCTVAYQGGQLACPCHGSVFDPAKGAEVVAGPAPTPLPKIPVQVEGSEVVRA